MIFDEFSIKNKLIRSRQFGTFCLILDVKKLNKRQWDEPLPYRARIIYVDCDTFKLEDDWYPYIDTLEKYHEIVA